MQGRPRICRQWWVVVLCAGVVGVAMAPRAQEGTGAEGGALPAGLARGYPGDVGIGGDPRVVFFEDFEAGSVAAVKGRWNTSQDGGVLSLSPDVPAGVAGVQSLLMTHVGGQGDGGYLYKRLPAGLEELYVRFYVKFDVNCGPIHHFVKVGGNNPATNWPMGSAGNRPTGSDRFITAIEPWLNEWRWDFYTYWMEMRQSGDGRYWGNSLINDGGFGVERGRWVCVEMMVKLNRPVTARNGEQAVWVDGRPHWVGGQVGSHQGEGFPVGRWRHDRFRAESDGAPFEGYRWRAVEELQINFIWLQTYITTAPAGHVSRVWFDNLVAATAPIGPVRPVR